MYTVTRTIKYTWYLRVDGRKHYWVAKQDATKFTSSWAAWNWVHRLSLGAHPEVKYSVAAA